MASTDWITYLTAPQRRVFVNTLQVVLAERNLAATVEDGVLQLGGAGVELAALAASCSVVSPLVYQDILEARIDELLLGVQGTEQAESLDDNWQKAQHFIKIRLFSAAEAAANADQILAAEISEDLTAVLVYDLPDTIASVPPDAPIDWPVDGEALWKIAMENLRAEEDPHIVRAALTEEADALVVSGESYFITSRLLILADILPASSFPYGALVTVPSRHIMVIHPITGPEVYGALIAMRLKALELYDEQPGPLSAEVYWWIDGTIEAVSVTVDEDDAQVTIEPSEEFAEVLEWLLRDDAEE